jgi:hypothetical protein
MIKLQENHADFHIVLGFYLKKALWRCCNRDENVKYCLQRLKIT